MFKRVHKLSNFQYKTDILAILSIFFLQFNENFPQLFLALEKITEKMGNRVKECLN